MTEFITLHLEPFAQSHPSFVKDTGDLLNKLHNHTVGHNCLLVTMDVESLYTNIDTTFGLQCASSTLDTDPHPIHPYILRLLHLVLTHNDFEFNVKTYLQLNGTQWRCVSRSHTPTL